ncbi:hypothetical protein [uncultured Alistipes sp.]|uniref:hypothetical protein n=1 Tax=uncultured Alistipes sp. TaxID=538949 RepID=UPI002621E029|nr:hypothetical protein [uncultured Alistipes sp.]
MDYEDESFVVDWGDGTQAQIVFDFYKTWKNHMPTTHYRICVDGKDCGPMLECVVVREV